MKKGILFVAALSVSASAFAQGTIIFANRNIPKADGSGTYNVPFWEWGGTGTKPAGTLPGGFTVGLFNAAGTQQLGSSPLRTDAAPSLNSAFFAIASQTLTVPDSPAGATPTLTVRAWQGASFAAARAGGGQWYEFTFTTRPLGGTPPGGGLPILPPGMTGFGPESGSGLELIPEPSVFALGALGIGALLLRRRSRQPAPILF